VLAFIALFAVVYLQRSQQVNDRRASANGARQMLSGLSNTCAGMIDSILEPKDVVLGSDEKSANLVAAAKRRFEMCSEMVAKVPFADLIEARSMPHALAFISKAEDVCAHLAFANLRQGLSNSERHHFLRLKKDFLEIEKDVETPR
jgi:hypothetical protein